MNIAALGISLLLPQAMNAVSSLIAGAVTSKQAESATENVAGKNNFDLNSFAASLTAAMQATGATQPQTNATIAEKDIASFLTKVENGTVTSKDLQNMQNELQQLKQSGSSGVQGHHRHHRQSASVSVNAQDTATSISISSDLISFLNKVVQGAATDSDVKTAASEPAALSASLSTSASTNQASCSNACSNTTQNSNLFAKTFLNSALNAYNAQAYFDSNTTSQN